MRGAEDFFVLLGILLPLFNISETRSCPYLKFHKSDNATNRDIAAWSGDKFRQATSPGRLRVNPLDAIRPS